MLKTALFTCGLLLFVLASPAVAAGKDAKKPSKPVPVAEQKKVPSVNDPSYQGWLEKYGAWDRLKKAYAESEDTPANVLKRAEIAIQMGTPQQALELLEKTPALEDAGLEVRRLWLAGQASRSRGDPGKAVLWFVQAARLMKPAEVKARFNAEPDLDALWLDVWRSFFWKYAANVTNTREAQELVLKDCLALGETVWGKDAAWAKARQALENPDKPTVRPAPPAPAKGAPPAPMVTAADRTAILSALAALCLEDFERAATALEPVGRPAVKAFWLAVVGRVKSGQPPEDLLPLAQDNAFKAAALFKDRLFAADPLALRAEWALGDPGAASWAKFRASLLDMPEAEAQAAIDRELGSLLITDHTSNLLKSLKFAIAVLAGDQPLAEATWKGLNKPALPLPLKVVGLVGFGQEPRELLPADLPAAARQLVLLSALAGAAGSETVLPFEAPFWLRVEAKDLEKAAERWPLDRLLVLADWLKRVPKAQGLGLARRAAFLFPDTELGADAVLRLARQAIKARQFALANRYLGLLDARKADKKLQAARLEIKAELELEAGHQDQALADYREMIASGFEPADMSRVQMAILLQQKGEFAEAKVQLLVLWDKRSTLPSPLAAEILWYLAEGEQSQGNIDGALDAYLQLAWQFPQENIWATTAMYRAAQIYEELGRLDTARRLLSTVTDRADTKEAKEAAKARLAAIEGKLGKAAPKSGMEYPF